MLVGRAFGGTVDIGWPSISISPAVGSSKPASMRSSVVLPQPDGPSSEKNSPRRMSNETSSTALTGPKCLETPWIEIMLSLCCHGFRMLPACWSGRRGGAATPTRSR